MVADTMRRVNPESTKGNALTPATLRAYCARHNVAHSQVARHLDVSPQAVNAALRADLTGRPVSQALLRSILDAANEILLEREETCQTLT